ncbi:MAG: tRNA (adenosine(37)-N6)-threonylcarbamoyltransferase complex dimerization subunit type 1 TsaB [Pseudomonadota bacterium]
MNVLAFDTCLGACSAAVGVGLGAPGERIETAFELRETGHAEALMPMIDTVMRRAGLAFADLDRVAVTHGPGTFTGTRIGIAAARALAFATRADVVTATSLWVMARSAADRLGSGGDASAIAVAVDARRDSVYFQVFDHGSSAPVGEPRLATIAAAAASRPDAVRLVGSGAELVATALHASRRAATVGLVDLKPEAATLLRMAPDLVPGARPSPLYLRPPDAKPQLEKVIVRAT